MFFPEQPEVTKSSFNVDLLQEIENHKNDLELMKIKIYSRTGKTLFSTDMRDVGLINKQKYFYEIVAMGRVYSYLVPKDTASLEGKKVPAEAILKQREFGKKEPGPWK